jgi:predicted MPP superfamily phosphohydrolase
MVNSQSFSFDLNKKGITLLYSFLLLGLVCAGFKHTNFFGQAQTAAVTAQTANDKYFQIAVLSDTQYYTAEKHNGTMQMFYNQIDWITANAEKEKIAYVVHVGDITDHGDDQPKEWDRAKDAMYRLEKPLPNMPYGIPYGVAVGNHDVRPNGNPNGAKEGYEKYFGIAHFKGRNYYGGSYNNENANHYDLFEANGEKFIVLYFAYNENIEKKKDVYDAKLEEQVFNWADDVLKKHADRKAIIVSHSILRTDASSNSNFVPGQGSDPKPGLFTAQGKKIYNKFKTSPNVFMMLCGHRSGEAYRVDQYQGNTIKTILTDYQSRRNPPYTEKDRNGGNGILRLMKIDQTNQKLSVRTFIPQKDKVLEEVDNDSNFSVPLYN